MDLVKIQKAVVEGQFYLEWSDFLEKRKASRFQEPAGFALPVFLGAVY